jgi:hypothetical protein
MWPSQSGFESCASPHFREIRVNGIPPALGAGNWRFESAVSHHPLHLSLTPAVVMRTPYFDFHDLAFGWKERRPNGRTGIYVWFSVRCALCGKFNWRNWRRYHPACRLRINEIIRESLENEELE